MHVRANWRMAPPSFSNKPGCPRRTHLHSAPARAACCGSVLPSSSSNMCCLPQHTRLHSAPARAACCRVLPSLTRHGLLRRDGRLICTRAPICLKAKSMGLRFQSAPGSSRSLLHRPAAASHQRRLLMAATEVALISRLQLLLSGRGGPSWTRGKHQYHTNQ